MPSQCFAIVMSQDTLSRHLPPAEKLPFSVDNRFYVDAKIGGGVTSVVYKATQRSSGEIVAVKHVAGFFPSIHDAMHLREINARYFDDEVLWTFDRFHRVSFLIGRFFFHPYFTFTTHRSLWNPSIRTLWSFSRSINRERANCSSSSSAPRRLWWTSSPGLWTSSWPIPTQNRCLRWYPNHL